MYPTNDPSQGQPQRGLQSAGGSIPPSPAQYNSASIVQQSYSNPYQTAYPTNPSAFAYPQQSHLQHQASLQQPLQLQAPQQVSPTQSRKRPSSDIDDASMQSASSLSSYGMPQQGLMSGQPGSSSGYSLGSGQSGGLSVNTNMGAPTAENATPVAKKGRTNTPWTPAEEQRLKIMRDAGNSWSEIAKTFPARTEGSVKKHWYKDMHYAEFAEDEGSFSAALMNAIKEYEASKWKVIGAKVGKPAKACEQYAKEHFKQG